MELAPEGEHTKPRQLTLFPASNSLEMFNMNILGQLLKTKNGNPFMVIMTDRYSNLRVLCQTQKKRHAMASISYE